MAAQQQELQQNLLAAMKYGEGPGEADYGGAFMDATSGRVVVTFVANSDQHLKAVRDVAPVPAKIHAGEADKTWAQLEETSIGLQHDAEALGKAGANLVSFGRVLPPTG